jgi:enoyl-CoA hydratase
MTEVRVARMGAALRITLDRPAALNALTAPMITALHAALDRAGADPAVSVVFLDGAGERAFCAGGDIAALRASVLAGTDDARAFWADEYRVNDRIATFPKPIVAFMDGITMGGGVGLAGHASHRVVTEKLMWAMPEVGIGFFPDVGGTWVLSRTPGELGTHLGLTGGRIGPADAVAAGLADAHVPSAAREPLLADLAAGVEPGAALAAHATPPEGASALVAARSWIDAAYVGDDPAAIVAALRARPEEDARKAAEAIESRSPMSVSVTLEALRRAARLPSLAAVLEQDLRVSLAISRHHDFAEGIRAQVVDKDRNPTWNPPSLAGVVRAAVLACFEA